MTATATTPADTRAAERLPGPDVVRAVALIGVVVMNYHGYLILRADGAPGTGWMEDLFDPWNGPLSTRFAATFVLVAGVGVTLMTARCVDARRSAADADDIAVGNDRVRTMRVRLVRRGLLLYVTGLLLEEIWPGTIIAVLRRNVRPRRSHVHLAEPMADRGRRNRGDRRVARPPLAVTSRPAMASARRG